MNSRWPRRGLRQAFRETFTVESKLAGLAIGANGSNIKKAKQIAWVQCNKFQASGLRFEVYGESEEAAKKAREILELCTDTFTFSQRYASKLIGRYGSNIDDIITKSGLNRIISSDGEDVRKDVELQIIGSPDALEKARLLLQRQLDEIQRPIHVVRESVCPVKEDKKGLKISMYRQPFKKFGFSLAGGKSSILPFKVDMEGLYVCKVEDGSTAAEAGLQVGDKLISVNDTDVEQAYRSDVKDFILSFSNIYLMVDRGDKKLPKEKKLVRNSNKHFLCPRYVGQTRIPCPKVKNCETCKKESKIEKQLSKMETKNKDGEGLYFLPTCTQNSPLDISTDWEDYKENITKLPAKVKHFYTANSKIEGYGLGIFASKYPGRKRNKQRKFHI